MVQPCWFSWLMIAAMILLHTNNVCCSMMLSTLERILVQNRLEQTREAIKRKYSESLEGVDTCIFPGAGGVDELVTELNSVTPNSLIIDWKEVRGSILTAGFDGEAVGESIAMCIQADKKTVHYIGILVGSFCANAAVTWTFQNHPQVNVRLTLLDPFCGHGVTGPNYGRDNFGKCAASTAIQIMNNDDPVPTTNDPLPHCFCVDVTQGPEKESFVPLPGDSTHSWPPAYFA